MNIGRTLSILLLSAKAVTSSGCYTEPAIREGVKYGIKHGREVAKKTLYDMNSPCAHLSDKCYVKLDTEENRFCSFLFDACFWIKENL